MNVLIVYAHPQPKSLTGSLLKYSVAALEKQGHTVIVSDLYAMRWKSQVDYDDFLLDPAEKPLSLVFNSKKSYEGGKLTEDVVAEQKKLLWADAVIFLFPLWWFYLPAILKGWVDRVFAYGFGYGVGEHSERRWGDRYGEGTMQGKRALLITTAGGWAEHYSPRGINGSIEELLFPINHGILHYPGFEVLPPFVLYRADHFQPSHFDEVKPKLQAKLENLFQEEPIPYRKQNFGDYHIPAMTLKESILPGHQGLSIHQSE